MNKLIIYLLAMILLLSNAFAIGIGGKNEQITAEGQKSIDLFITNSGHEDAVVDVGVLGENEGVSVSPARITINSTEEIKKFTVFLDFSRIKNYPVKIYASESRGNGGQVSAVANVVYSLQISHSSNSVSEDFPKEEPKAESPALNETAKEIGTVQEKLAISEEPPKTAAAAKEFSGAAAAKEQAIQQSGAKTGDLKKILLYSLAIVIFIIVADMVYIKKKHPLEEYIIKSRKIGKNDEEIKSKLSEAGWSDLIIDSHLKK